MFQRKDIPCNYSNDENQKRIQNAAKHLRWSFCKNNERLKAVNDFHKNLILDISKDSEYAIKFTVKLSSKSFSILRDTNEQQFCYGNHRAMRITCSN